MNSSTNTPKPVLSSPSETESQEGQSTIDSAESPNRRKFPNGDRNLLKDLHESRIKALRQQLDYINNSDWMFEKSDGAVDNHFVFKQTEEEDDESLRSEELYINEQLYSLRDDDEYLSYDDTETNKGKDSSSNVCFEKSGTITYLDDTYGLIDGSLYFSTDVVNVPNLKLNDEVTYLAYRLREDDAIKVSRVLSKADHWFDDVGNAGNSREDDTIYNADTIIESSIVAKVVKKVDRNITIEPGNVTFSLNDVASTFIPIVGDFLQVYAKQQWTEDAPCGKQAGSLLEVDSILPLRNKTLTGDVTHWQGNSENGCGEINKHIFFCQDALKNGYVPNIGDKVLLEAIESDQGKLCWRAILVVPQEIKQDFSNGKVAKNGNIIPVETSNEGISIVEENDGKPIELGISKDINIRIENISESPCTLICARFLSKVKDSQLTLLQPDKDKKTYLKPGQSVVYSFKCRPRFLGLSFEKMVFIFTSGRIVHQFALNVTGKSCTDLHDVSSSWKFRNRKTPYDNHNNFISGIRPVKPPSFIPVQLGLFPIPDKIQKLIFENFGKKDKMALNDVFTALEDLIPSFTTNLTFNNYRERWHSLIYLEEIEHKIRIAQYYMEKAFLAKHDEYLCLEIIGLAERRPSLVVGDYVIARDPWQLDKPGYQGLIHHVKSNSIWLKFHPDFHTKYVGQDVLIEFYFSRTTYRKFHQAINLAVKHLGVNFLFSSRVTVKDEQVALCTDHSLNAVEKLGCKKTHINWFNEYLNRQQKEVVINVICGVARPLPYIIFGPPGTGKTITVVETVLQILSHLEGSRILIATPSNSSANLITERLIESGCVTPGIVIRIISHNVAVGNSIPDKIKPYCATLDIATEGSSEPKMQVGSDGLQVSCPPSFIGRHRVTIGTCTMMGTLARVGLPEGHFTHLIVDEAGQATEPEIMIPLSFLDVKQGQAILAGDPMQLGPVVSCRYAEQFGLGESFLARLIERFPYQRDKNGFKGNSGYDPRLVTRLVINYRSTPEVIKYCNKTFYDDSLEPHLSSDEGWPETLLKTINDSFADTSCYMKGIVFYGIRGVNYQMEESPSWFNPQEAAMVLMFVSKLYKAGLSIDDIGVITPYILQVRKIRALFESIGLESPKIGSVEEFQGQERNIIILSTVRSCEDWIAFDRKHYLGFVNNPRRLNVALSRAQVLTVVFGNPHLLATDKLWREVIQYSVNSETYIGCDLPQSFNTENGNIT